jgi:hypothetical protein
LDQFFSLRHGSRMVDVQYGDSRAPDISQAEKNGAVPAKVFVPIVLAWME